MIGRARIVPFRSGDPAVDLESRRWARTAREIQTVQDQLADARRRRDAMLDVAAETAARVAAMSPAERLRRARELGLSLRGVDPAFLEGPDGPEVA